MMEHEDAATNGERDHYDGRPFEAFERRRLRQIIREWDRYQWLWGLLGRTGAYTTVVLGAFWAAHDVIFRVVTAIWRALLQQP